MSLVSLLFVLISADPVAQPPTTSDFATEIVPILTKAGCNAGACHGAAAGRGGLHLSLFGSDAAADYEAIVHAYEGRRINMQQPARSLLLRKPTGYLDHEGGLLWDEESAATNKITNWIKAGAAFGTPRTLIDFQVSPQQQLAKSLNEKIPLRATATFANEQPLDVTKWTVFSSADPTALEIHPQTAVATIHRRGQHTVIARYLDRVVSVQLSLSLSDDAVDLAHSPRVNFIDDEVLLTLSRLRIPPSPPAEDATYLRRVTLDLTGRLPTPDEVSEYQADQAPDKRTRLVDRLLASEAFNDYWTLRFARLLNIHSLPNEREGLMAYSAWLRTQIASNAPINVWAEQLLVATGDSHAVGPANFGRMVPDARGQAELVGRFFLGARLGCANCHDHPLDRWTQNDYHGLAAVFARLERGRHVQFVARGSVTNLRTGQPATPRIPGHRDLLPTNENHQTVARWLISRENPLFAQALVNRLWQGMFGRGLVEPTDDLRATNPATHPQLLQQLADDFAAHGYDLRHTLRQIALSQTYARGGQHLPGNATDDRFYARSYHRPLSAEVLADAIADVTGVSNGYAHLAAQTRAVQIVDFLSPAPVLEILGRCGRGSNCDEAAPSARGLPAQLHLLNGDFINAKLIDKQGRLQQLLAAGAADREIVKEFYLRALAREPTVAELTRWTRQLNSTNQQERTERCEDFVWSLLSSREFSENH
ncbi:hypothetical protein ETAA8_20950 [Anatilimnocola aggregata]|uniref:Uncharacterized protein n=1 Tax=Anatilimnocola aggregata TaxID=2528021 RepID=A0A517Y9Y5_9BACT|nr:DUF1549 and DUF1553 domain-containing protein [Anatilimnocola aggregata]QDU27011.1 hypothetical protein ETAA8_20950 [Anatilimnocola aggregata]